MKTSMLSWALPLVAAVTGLLAFLYPFLLPAITRQVPAGAARLQEMPLLLLIVLSLSLAVLLFELQGKAADARIIALLGVLVAINSSLRFIEVALPGPGGFTPIFVLIILVGYVYGGRLGFLMGALTLLVSALITGGVGPWLPGQMFAAGWVGLTAPACRLVVRPLKAGQRPAEVWILALFGAAWAFLYGALLSLWSWPFIAGPAGQYWAPGIGLGETLRRYAAYYLLTSAAWDAAGAAGNLLLLLALAAPSLRILRRFQKRFGFTYRPAPAPEGSP
jgi:energy-coupling factor transport system substrate-specific component